MAETACRVILSVTRRNRNRATTKADLRLLAERLSYRSHFIMSQLFSPPSGAPTSGNLLVWLGPPFFYSYLQSCGWTVVQAGHDPLRPRTWEDILSLTDGRTPKVLLVADSSIPPPVIGMENFPCLTVFYAIDSHIHSWYPLYGQGFDLCLVSLRDHLPLFARGRLSADHVRWNPPYALDHHRLPSDSPEMEWDLTFVGTVDPVRTPERHAFLTEVRKRFPGLHMTTGSFTDPYSKSRLILNECTYNELNFRVFEALGCGRCLLTPGIGPALTDLFTDGKELFLYPTRDVSALLDLTQRLLDNDTLRQEVAHAGLAAVDAKHRASHRASALDAWLRMLFSSREAAETVENRLRAARGIHQDILRFMYLLHAESVSAPQLREAYLRAALPGR